MLNKGKKYHWQISGSAFLDAWFVENIMPGSVMWSMQHLASIYKNSSFNNKYKPRKVCTEPTVTGARVYNISGNTLEKHFHGLVSNKLDTVAFHE